MPRSSINTYVFVLHLKVVFLYKAKIIHMFTVNISQPDISEHKAENMHLRTENSLAISFWCD